MSEVEEREHDELIKINDDLKSDKIKINDKSDTSLYKKKSVDFFDPNYRLPDYHSEEEGELFKI